MERQLICCFSFFSFRDRKSTRLNSSHGSISYAVFCLKNKKSKIELGIVVIDDQFLRAAFHHYDYRFKHVTMPPAASPVFVLYRQSLLLVITQRRTSRH